MANWIKNTFVIVRAFVAKYIAEILLVAIAIAVLVLPRWFLCLGTFVAAVIVFIVNKIKAQ